jgi:polar amino acid transport system substrate-binding protein
LTWSRIAILLAVLALGGHLPGMVAHSAARQPLRLVFADELAPISFVEDGKLTGIAVDVAIEVFRRRLGRAITVSAYPWERAQHMVEDGEADGFITIATPAREAYVTCGRATVLRAPVHPIVRRDHPRMAELRGAKSLEDLKQFEIASYRGNGWAKQHLEGYNVYYAADFAAHIRGLAQGRADLGIVSTAAGPYYVSKLGLGGQLEMLPLVLDTLEYVLCLGGKSPSVSDLADFERVLDVLRADGGLGAIFGHYGLQAEDFY